MALLNFLNGGSGGVLPFGQQQQQPGLMGFLNNNGPTLMALGGGLASGGIGGGFTAAAKAQQDQQAQQLALAHLAMQQNQFQQGMALKQMMASPEYLGKTEEQKAAIGQKYAPPMALPPGGSLYKPGAPGQEGNVVAQNDVGILSNDAVDRLAHQVAAGDMTPLQQQGYGPLGAVNRAKINERVSAIRGEKGISGEQAATKRIEYGAETAAGRATAMREVQVQTPAAEFKRMAPIALAASEALDRTKYPDFNALTNAVQRGVGGENVVAAHTALTSIANIYSRVISPSGQSTDSTRATAFHLVNEAMAKGQVRTAFEMMQREISAAESGVKDVQIERLRNFLQKQGINVPPAEGAPTSQPAAAPVAAPAAAGGGGWSVQRVP